jgi:hypothetical protein
MQIIGTFSLFCCFKVKLRSRDIRLFVSLTLCILTIDDRLSTIMTKRQNTREEDGPEIRRMELRCQTHTTGDQEQ